MRTIGPVAALLAVGVVASPVDAQQPSRDAHADSSATQQAIVAAPLVSPPSAPSAEAEVPGRRTLTTRSFLLLLGAGVGANAAWPISRDQGLLKDRWDGKDKGVHAVIEFALTQSAMEAGVRPSVAWLGVCGAGAAFEVTQGYVSYRDMVANCVGAGAAVLWRRYWTGR